MNVLQARTPGPPPQIHKQLIHANVSWLNHVTHHMDAQSRTRGCCFFSSFPAQLQQIKNNVDVSIMTRYKS